MKNHKALLKSIETSQKFIYSNYTISKMIAQESLKKF